MSAGSITIVVMLFALVGFALWRNFKRGAPCACGGSRKDCTCCCCDAESTSSIQEKKGKENGHQ